MWSCGNSYSGGSAYGGAGRAVSTEPWWFRLQRPLQDRGTT